MKNARIDGSRRKREDIPPPEEKAMARMLVEHLPPLVELEKAASFFFPIRVIR